MKSNKVSTYRGSDGLKGLTAKWVSSFLKSATHLSEPS